MTKPVYVLEFGLHPSLFFPYSIIAQKISAIGNVRKASLASGSKMWLRDTHHAGYVVESGYATIVRMPADWKDVVEQQVTIERDSAQD